MRKPTLHQRLRAKNRSQAMIVALTWYTEDSWAEVKASATDPESFEASFAQWKAVAVAARREFQRSGVRAVECLIAPAELLAWCAAEGLENNSTARAQFVSEQLSASMNAGVAAPAAS
jgi:hypothetical protein